VVLAVILILLALVLGGFGLIVKGLLWLLVLAGILFIAGALFGFVGRAGRSAT